MSLVYLSQKNKKEWVCCSIRRMDEGQDFKGKKKDPCGSLGKPVAQPSTEKILFLISDIEPIPSTREHVGLPCLADSCW